jgi:putative acetyltransferase
MNAPTKAALRPMLPDDVPLLATIFRDAIEQLTQDEYSDEQRRAWASRAEDEDAFADHLGKRLTLVATMDGEAVGFATLEGNDLIDMLYVHPSFVRSGVATLLLDALEKLATARGAAALRADVSDTAQPLFAQRGFVPQQRNTVLIDDEWLGNTAMKKQLKDVKSVADPFMQSVDQIGRKPRTTH